VLSHSIVRRLRGGVDRDGFSDRALTRHRRDDGFVLAHLVVFTWRRVFLAHCGQRGGEDNPLHAHAVLQCGFQDRRGSQYSGEDEFCTVESPMAAGTCIQCSATVRPTTGIDCIVVEGGGGVGFREVLDDDELEQLAVLRELFFEKCAPGQSAYCAAHGVPGFFTVQTTR
jgi:hypothetical protein